MDTNMPYVVNAHELQLAGSSYQDIRHRVQLAGQAMPTLLEASLIKLELIERGENEFDPPLTHQQNFVRYGALSPVLQLYLQHWFRHHSTTGGFFRICL